MLTCGEIDRLKRTAKKLKRESGVTHSHALNSLAQQHGFPGWAQLVAQHNLDVVHTPMNKSEWK